MSGSTTTSTSERAIVLGFDGAPWHLIERWTDDGHLPNFARLREEGAAGPLESTQPPTTPLAWPSIATGVWPDKHGIYGFQNLSSEYSHRMYTSRDRRHPALWEVLSPAIVGNVPMTYPPDQIDGTIVSGMMTPSTGTTYTHPPEFADAIDREIPDYEISLDYPSYADRLEEFPRAVAEMLAKRRRLMDLLREERDDWRLFFFVFTAPDRFQHLIWDEEKLLAHYRLLDEILGDVMTVADDDGADLYVVSDHGFGPIDTLVYLNYFLEREGYLERREDEGTRGALSTLGISRDRVTKALETVGITEELLASTLPRGLVDSVASQIPGDHALYDVDYEGTTAFAHDTGNVYVNDTERFDRGQIAPSRVPEIKSELTELFESVTDPETGDPVLEVADGDHLYPNDDRSPDLVVTGRGVYESRTSISDEPFGASGKTVASHRSEGILLCRGPAIEAGATLQGARVVDVAPTLLHVLGEPVPRNADGRVLFDAIRDGSSPARTKVKRCAAERIETDERVDEDFTDVEDRLKGLGYME